MKRTYSDGTYAIELSALELDEKLAAIIPPPPEAERDARQAKKLKRGGERGSVCTDQALSWSELLVRVFRPMTLRTAVFGAPARTRILRGLERGTGPTGVAGVEAV